MEGLKLFDLAATPLREVNRYLHRDAVGAGVKRVKILNADGAHSIAAGLAAPLEVEIDGHAGYYAGTCTPTSSCMEMPGPASAKT